MHTKTTNKFVNVVITFEPINTLLNVDELCYFRWLGKVREPK